MNTHQKIGKKIRLARKQIGMTQAELAEKLDKTGAALAYLEQGKRRISTDVLTAIARITGKPLSFFYEEQDDSSAQIKKQLTDLRQHLDGIKQLLDEAEKNKAEAENKLTLFRSLLDQSEDVIIIWDPETGRPLDCNSKAYQAVGYSREEFFQKTIMDFETGIPTLEVWKECVKAAKRSSFIISTTPVKRNGKVMPVEVSVKYVSVDGKGYIVAISRLIEDRKEYEALATDQLKSNRAYLESFSSGVFFYDLQGHITEVNSIMWDMLGVPANERSEHDFTVIAENLRKGGVFEFIKDHMDSRKESSKVFKFQSLWAKPLELHIRIVPLRHLGYILGVQGVVEKVKGKK